MLRRDGGALPAVGARNGWAGAGEGPAGRYGGGACGAGRSAEAVAAATRTAADPGGNRDGGRRPRRRVRTVGGVAGDGRRTTGDQGKVAGAALALARPRRGPGRPRRA